MKKATFEKAVGIRKGGTRVGYIPTREISALRRYIRTLTEGAPYHRAIQLVDVIEEQMVERLLRIERFPLNNRNSKTALRVEKEFSQELVKALNRDRTTGSPANSDKSW